MVSGKGISAWQEPGQLVIHMGDCRRVYAIFLSMCTMMRSEGVALAVSLSCRMGSLSLSVPCSL